MRFMKVIALPALLIVTLMAGSAFAQCFITGSIESSMTEDPELPSYTYTATIEWGGMEHGLSHFNLLIDLEGGNCSCYDVMDAIMLPEIAGSSNGEPDDCMVYYEAFFECNGDPSIPGVGGIIIKFEPIEDEGCEPSTTGTATVVFYSNNGPAPIDETAITLYDKFAGYACEGTLTGEFPGLDCDPVSDTSSTWGSVKGLYR